MQPEGQIHNLLNDVRIRTSIVSCQKFIKIKAFLQFATDMSLRMLFKIE